MCVVVHTLCNKNFLLTYFLRYTVAEWYGAGLATVRSWVGIPFVAAAYQRQLSVHPSGAKTGIKRAYHAMHWPRVRGLAASAGVRLRAKETDIM